MSAGALPLGLPAPYSPPDDAAPAAGPLSQLVDLVRKLDAKLDRLTSDVAELKGQVKPPPSVEVDVGVAARGVRFADRSTLSASPSAATVNPPARDAAAGLAQSCLQQPAQPHTQGRRRSWTIQSGGATGFAQTGPRAQSPTNGQSSNHNLPSLISGLVSRGRSHSIQKGRDGPNAGAGRDPLAASTKTREAADPAAEGRGGTPAAAADARPPTVGVEPPFEPSAEDAQKVSQLANQLGNGAQPLPPPPKGQPRLSLRRTTEDQAAGPPPVRSGSQQLVDSGSAHPRPGTGTDEAYSPPMGPEGDSINNHRLMAARSLPQLALSHRNPQFNGVGGATSVRDAVERGLARDMGEEEMALLTEVMNEASYYDENSARWMLLPDEPFRRVVDTVYSVVTLFVLLYVSLMVTTEQWEEQPHIAVIVWFTLWFFMNAFFVLLNFRTAFLDEWELVGDEADEIPEVQAHYLRSGRFAFDMVTGLPYDLVAYACGSIRWFRIFQCIRMVQFLRPPTLFNGSNPLSPTPLWVKFAFFVSLYIAGIHLMACGWLRMQHHEGNSADGFAPDENETLTTRYRAEYISSLYFTVTTMTTVGFGDIAARTENSQVFAIFAMVVGVSVYAFVMGNVTTFLRNDDHFQSQMKEKKRALSSVMRHYSIPLHVQKEAFCIYPAIIERIIANSEETMRELPDFMQVKLYHYMKISLIRTVPLFRRCNQECLSALAMACARTIVPPKTFLVEAGEYGDEMFVIVNGIVEVFVITEDDEHCWLANLKDGSWFGELCLLHSGTRRSASVRALTACELLRLCKADFDRTLEHLPELAAMIFKEAELRMAAAAAHGDTSPRDGESTPMRHSMDIGDEITVEPPDEVDESVEVIHRPGPSMLWRRAKDAARNAPREGQRRGSLQLPRLGSDRQVGFVDGKPSPRSPEQCGPGKSPHGPGPVEANASGGGWDGVREADSSSGTPRGRRSSRRRVLVSGESPRGGADVQRFASHSGPRRQSVQIHRTSSGASSVADGCMTREGSVMRQYRSRQGSVASMSSQKGGFSRVSSVMRTGTGGKGSGLQGRARKLMHANVGSMRKTHQGKAMARGAMSRGAAVGGHGCNIDGGFESFGSMQKIRQCPSNMASPSARVHTNVDQSPGEGSPLHGSISVAGLREASGMGLFSPGAAYRQRVSRQPPSGQASPAMSPKARGLRERGHHPPALQLKDAERAPEGRRRNTLSPHTSAKTESVPSVEPRDSPHGEDTGSPHGGVAGSTGSCQFRTDPSNRGASDPPRGSPGPTSPAGPPRPITDDVQPMALMPSPAVEVNPGMPKTPCDDA